MTAPTPNPKRLSETGTPAGELLSRAREQTADAQPGQRERVWRKMSAPRPSAVRWLVPIAVAAAAALLLVVRPWAPSGPLATVALTAGVVETHSSAGWTATHVGDALADGTGLRTGAHGRTYARFGGSGALLLENTRVQLGGRAAHPMVRVDEGTVVVAARGPEVAVVAGDVTVETGTLYAVQVAAERAVEVFVFEGVAHVRGPAGSLDVTAGHSWSRSGPGSAQTAHGEAALARALATASSHEAPLSLEGTPGTLVSVDGVAVGGAPLTLLASAGAHPVSARYDDDQVVTFEALVGAAATRFELPPAPAILPNTSDDALRARAAASTKQTDRDALSWELARRLTAAGRYAEAVVLDEALARGDGARAEAALYEVGRLRLRFLADPKSALAAFTEHQRRFPGGALAQEVGLSAIEAQLQLGELEPALAAMDGFVARFPGSERLGEVRFLQAQVHKDLGHCEQALPLFLQLLDDAGHGDDSLYLAAWCEKALNRSTAARGHLVRYLERFPAGRHAAEARAALGKK